MENVIWAMVMVFAPREPGQPPFALVDLDAQRQLYRGLCNAFAETPSVSGFYVWNWFGFGGPRDGGFTPRGKPAAAELENCFARQWPSRSRGGDRS